MNLYVKYNTCMFRESSPAAMAVLVDVVDKFLIFFRSPGAFLEASTFITARRPTHSYYLAGQIMIIIIIIICFLMIWLPPQIPPNNSQPGLYIHTLSLSFSLCPQSSCSIPMKHGLRGHLAPLYIFLYSVKYYVFLLFISSFSLNVRTAFTK